MRKSYFLAALYSVFSLWYAGSLTTGIRYDLSRPTIEYSIRFIIGFAICFYAGQRTFVSPERYELRIKQLLPSGKHRPAYNSLQGSLGAAVVISALVEGIYFRSPYAALGGGLASCMVAITASMGRSLGTIFSVGRPHILISRTVWTILQHCDNGNMYC